MDQTDRRRIVFVTLAAAAAGLLVWLFLIRDDDSGSSTDTGARPATVADISSLAESLGHPVYWAGPRSGVVYELTETDDGRVYVRYLTGGAQIGDPRPNFLTVGTYPVSDPVAALHRAAKESGGQLEDGPRGSIILTSEGNPTSVYLAYPDSQYQIEVFAPNGVEASSLARSGAIAPVP